MIIIEYFIINWRKYGAVPLLMAQVFAMLFCGDTINGCVIALWLTIPCGIKIVNLKWYFWYPRQLYFGTLSILTFI